MSYENRNSFPSKAVFRGKMLVASFPEATPPVLWRWLAADVSSGFGLRKNESKVDLLRYDGGATPAVIASFASVEAGEQALARLSSALLRHEAPWQVLLKWLALFLGLAAVVAGGVMLNIHYQAEEARHLMAERAASEHARPPTGQLQQRTQDAMQQKQRDEAAKATPPAPGASVDVDSIYH